MSTLRGAWDAAAADWIAWAREPGADRWFWSHNLPALLELIPPPPARVLDLGAGEGRVSRALAERGYDVAGVEQSPALAAAAREAAPQLELHVADATSLPLPDASVGAVVASMVLLNLDDLDGALREVARVLRPGGVLAASTSHPLRSMIPAGGYLRDVTFTETRERAGVRMDFVDRHRPLGALFGALERSGLVVAALREPAEARFLHLKALRAS